MRLLLKHKYTLLLDPVLNWKTCMINCMNFNYWNYSWGWAPKPPPNCCLTELVDVCIILPHAPWMLECLTRLRVENDGKPSRSNNYFTTNQSIKRKIIQGSILLPSCIYATKEMVVVTCSTLLLFGMGATTHMIAILRPSLAGLELPYCSSPCSVYHGF